MTDSHSRAEKRTGQTDRTDPRDEYIQLGRDEFGAFHTYRTADETIHVVDPDHGRMHVEDLDATGRDVDDWMAYIEDKKGGWAERRYGVALPSILSDALDREAEHDEPPRNCEVRA